MQQREKGDKDNNKGGLGELQMEVYILIESNKGMTKKKRSTLVFNVRHLW